MRLWEHAKYITSYIYDSCHDLETLGMLAFVNRSRGGMSDVMVYKCWKLCHSNRKKILEFNISFYIVLNSGYVLHCFEDNKLHLKKKKRM